MVGVVVTDEKNNGKFSDVHSVTEKTQELSVDNIKNFDYYFKRFVAFFKYPKNCSVNNGEPTSFIVKHSIRDIVVFLFLSLTVCAVFEIREISCTFITDNDYDYETLSEEDEYSDVLRVSSDIELDTDLVSFNSIKNLVSSSYQEKKVSKLTNLSNSTLITSIYESLENGFPVVVYMSNVDTDFLQYAVVTGINCENEKITVVYQDDTTKTMDFDDFIEKTRFEDLEEKTHELTAGLSLGIYNINTAIFIGEYE